MRWNGETAIDNPYYLLIALCTRRKRKRLPPNRPIANGLGETPCGLTRREGADAFASIGHEVVDRHDTPV